MDPQDISSQQEGELIVPQTHPRFSPISIIYLIIIALIILTLTFYARSKIQTVNTYHQQPSLSPTLYQTPTKNLSPMESGEWKTYSSVAFINFQLKYPPNWEYNVSEIYGYTNLVIMSDKHERERANDSENNERINVRCPMNKGATEFSNPHSWEPNEGGYKVKHYKELTINNMPAIQYIWSDSDVDGSLTTEIKRVNDPVVCSFKQLISFGIEPIEDVISKQEVYNRIIQSFHYLD